jgi:nucleotide-binding universal stress UspA family protein
VLVGVDGSESARHALAWAVFIAKHQHKPIRAVSCFHVPVVNRPDLLGFTIDQSVTDGIRSAHTAFVAAARERVAHLDATVEFDGVVVEGAPQTVIPRMAKGDDVIVVGSLGTTGFVADLMGTVATAVVRHSQCPVVVVPGEAGLPHGTHLGSVTVGVDGSESGDKALRWAYGIASEGGASELRVVHSWESSPGLYLEVPEVPTGRYEQRGRNTLDHAVQRLAEEVGGFGQLAVTKILSSEVSRVALTEASNSTDLLVIGSHGHGIVARMLLGSVSRSVVEHAHCAVAVIRS